MLTDGLNQVASLDGENHYLFEMGITRDRYGELSLDTEVLGSVLSSDPDLVASIFSEDGQGYAARFSDIADRLLDDEGLFANREESLKSRLDALGESEDRLERRLEAIEARYTEQFTALDVAMAELQSTSSYLTSMLSSLPTISSKSG
jgi:flagellar hook-associated protein 2